MTKLATIALKSTTCMSLLAVIAMLFASLHAKAQSAAPGSPEIGNAPSLAFPPEAASAGTSAPPGAGILPPPPPAPGSAPSAFTPASQPEPPKAARRNPYPFLPSDDKADCALCRANLEKINRAIQAYRRDHKDLPNWLSDLYPQYLPDPNVFICPVTRKTGRLSAYGPLDPEIYCSYSYEFAPDPLWTPNSMSVRDWKRQQMAVIGSDVPIVRCLLHDPVQNLSFGGRIYESGLMWEDNFTDVVRREDLQPKDGSLAQAPSAPELTPASAPPSAIPSPAISEAQSK